MFVDATYCKARVNRRVVSQAVVVATGVCGDGRREVLGFGVGDSEDGAFWTAFLRSLKARGLGGVQLVIADAHLGLRQAVQAVMAGAAIQRCRVHFLRNVLAQVPKLEAMLRDSAEELLAFTSFPVSHWKKIWSTDERFKALWRCLPVLAWLGSGLGVVGPEAKSRAVGLEALPRSFAP